MDKTVYVVSDLHLGPGKDPDGTWNPLEDFVYGADFARFVDTIGQSKNPLELVIAGDFLEYPQTIPEHGPTSPSDQLSTTEAESFERTEVILGRRPDIASGHPEVFAALRRFMMEGHSITLIVGNHDIDLFWDSVWAAIFDTIYPPGAWGDLRRVTYSHVIGTGERGRVHIEHGHEHDPANRFGDRMNDIFGVDRYGVKRLKRCWGTLFVDMVYNQLERDRWFIDNVKPIPRVIKMGLRNDFFFTATALGLISRFLLTSGLPPMLGGSGADESMGEVLGATAPEAEHIIANLADDELRRAIEAQLQDPAFRRELESSLNSMSNTEWGMVQAGAAPPVTLDDVSGGMTNDQVLGGGDGVEDSYQQEARAVMESDPRIGTVIMGHTHGPIDGYIKPMDLSDGRKGLYFNTGTWTRHLKHEGQQSYTWQEIGDESSYTSTFTFVKLEPQPDGSYRPRMGSWALGDH